MIWLQFYSGINFKFNPVVLQFLLLPLLSTQPDDLNRTGSTIETNRTRSNAIERLKFDCPMQSNLNWILLQFSGLDWNSIAFDCFRLRFDYVRLCSIVFYKRVYGIHPVFSTAEMVNFHFPRSWSAEKYGKSALLGVLDFAGQNCVSVHNRPPISTEISKFIAELLNDKHEVNSGWW